MPPVKEVSSWVASITEDGQLRVKTVTRWLDDDGSPFCPDQVHSKVLEPGDDVSGESERVQRTAATEWTSDVITAFATARAARKAEGF